MQIFDEEWIGAASEALAALPSVADVDAVIAYTISGHPNGRVTLTVTLTDGAVTGIAVGKSAVGKSAVGKSAVGKSIGPDIAISMSYADAVAILSGQMTSDAGYMSGAVKVDGDYPRWLLDLRPVRLAAIEALTPVMAQTSTE